MDKKLIELLFITQNCSGLKPFYVEQVINVSRLMGRSPPTVRALQWFLKPKRQATGRPQAQIPLVRGRSQAHRGTGAVWLAVRRFPCLSILKDAIKLNCQQ